MKRNVVAIALLAPVLTLVGCSTPLERRQASGDFDYLEQPVPTNLVVPEGLNTPRSSNEYVIPNLGNQTDRSATGPRVDVRPPLQVMPLAEGTRLQDGSDRITVIVETNDDNRALGEEINTTVVTFLNDENIPISANEGGTLLTGWIENEEVVGKSWFRDKVYEIRQRYRFDIAVKDHGRSGALTIELAEHEEGLDGIDDSIVLTDSDRRRYAIDMLNRVISYLNFERKQRQKTLEITNGRGFKTSLGQDNNGNTAFIAEAKFDNVWRRMDKVLPMLGFEIKDLDQSLGTYFVDFNPDVGFWANIWGSEEALPLEEGPYRVNLVRQGDFTSITMLDNDENPLDTETVTALYNRFSELLQKSSKDL